MGDMIARGMASNAVVKAAKYSHPFGYNLKDGLYNYRAKLSQYASRLCKIYCFGDSITRGECSSDKATKSWVGVFRSLMQAKYGGNTAEGYIPAYETQLASFDNPRWSVSGSYVLQPGGLINNAVKLTSTSSSLTVTFNNATSVTLLYALISGAGSANVTIDGNSVGTINTSGPSLSFIGSTTYSVTSGSHTMVITPTSSSPVTIEGIVTNNASTGIEVDRIGVSGVSSGYFNNTYVTGRITNMPPDLAIVALGMNDSNTYYHNSISTYMSNMGTFIQTLQSTGASVLLLTYHRPKSTFIGVPSYDAFIQAQYALADQYNCALIDGWQAWGCNVLSGDNAWNWAYNNNMYGQYTDNGSGTPGNSLVHPSDIGYLYYGQLMFQHLALI
jgi:lysophospholipase L1-like esterase